MSSGLLDRPPARLVVPPRYLTPRDHRFRTQGPNVAKVARALGLDPMPWQVAAWDLIGEVDDTGLYRWPLVLVSVPRQSGKTAGGLAQAVHRCLQAPNRRAWWTAQTGQDARDKFRELVATVMGSPLRELVAGRPRLQNGAECLTFVNGSTLRPHPPTRDALHGKQSDHNDVDEGWAHDEPTGADLLQAITPTQATRPGAQTVVWSTRGDAGSAWFHGLVARGAAGEPGVALVDYGIPDDADPDDLEVVAAHHPAAGHTITRGSLESARVTFGLDVAGWARAYGNRATGGRVRVIPEPAWAAGRWEDDAGQPLALPAGRPAYGVGVYEPRDGGDVSGALVAAVAGPGGVPVLEVVETRPGRAWLVDRVLQLEDRGLAVAVDRRGPAGPVADALELAGVELLEGVSYPVACQDLWDRLCDREAVEAGPRLRARPHPALDSAVDVAGRRFIGEGAWLWDARFSTGDVAPLAAGTLAAYALAHAQPAEPIGRSMFA